MKSVRIWYTKTGRLRYISHLDMNRVMDRIIRRTRLPVWYTEGFNPHPHIMFALPLSLGFESEYEAMDIKITDDSLPLSKIADAFAAAVPDGMTVIAVTEPVMKFKEIRFARFVITFECDCAADIAALMGRGEVTVQKTTKKGGTRTIDIYPFIKQHSVTADGAATVLDITLSAGNDDNINPLLFVGALEADCGRELPVTSLKRVMLYNGDMNELK